MIVANANAFSAENISTPSHMNNNVPQAVCHTAWRGYWLGCFFPVSRRYPTFGAASQAAQYPRPREVPLSLASTTVRTVAPPFSRSCLKLILIISLSTKSLLEIVGYVDPTLQPLLVQTWLVLKYIFGNQLPQIIYSLCVFSLNHLCLTSWRLF